METLPGSMVYNAGPLDAVPRLVQEFAVWLILGLHKIEKRPVVIDDEMVIRPMMYVALSYDHRIVDGRKAVQFLVRVKELIADPEVLLLEG